MKFNLHTHTRFSDGTDDPSAYIEEAIRQGFHTLGISDHSPVPFDNTFAIPEGRLQEYCDEISIFRHPASLSILIALEIDYIPGITESTDYYRKNYSFDYFIGSVHFVKGPGMQDLWFIDGPDVSIYDKGLTDIFGGDIRKGVTAYYHQQNGLIINEKPDILGHMDKIKMYNRGRYFSEDDPWYESLVDETLSLVKESGCVVEVNTRGIYKKRSDSLFPGPSILKKIKALGIPITLSSDAHKPSELSGCFPEATQILKELGYKSIAMKTKSGWTDQSI